MSIKKQGLKLSHFSDCQLWVLTFTAVRRHLSERVVAAITLTSDDASFTLTLAGFSVTSSGERADRVAVTQQAGVTAFKPVVVVLETRWETQVFLFLGLAAFFFIHLSNFPPMGQLKLQLLVKKLKTKIRFSEESHLVFPYQHTQHYPSVQCKSI